MLKAEMSEYHPQFSEIRDLTNDDRVHSFCFNVMSQSD